MMQLVIEISRGGIIPSATIELAEMALSAFQKLQTTLVRLPNST